MIQKNKHKKRNKNFNKINQNHQSKQKGGNKEINKPFMKSISRNGLHQIMFLKYPNKF